MANSYTDVPEIKFHMEHPLMKRIVELKERNYADYGQYDYASSAPTLRMSMLKALTARTVVCATPLRPTRTSMLPSRLVSAA